MAFKGFVIVRQEESAKEVAGQTLGLVKVSAEKPREAENKARWSGTIESAKIVQVETTGTAAEARQNVAAMFPGMAATAAVSVTEANFLES